MKSELGLLGVFVFAIGGAILFDQLLRALGRYPYDEGFSTFMGFLIGFLLLGSGLWVIALSGKPDTKQNPS